MGGQDKGEDRCFYFFQNNNISQVSTFHQRRVSTFSLNRLVVTMFSMNKYISKHLLGRAEKGQYVHKEKDSSGESEGESDEKSSDEESD